MRVAKRNNWWDYVGTDYEHRYSDDCLKEAVRRADGRDLVFASCLNPQDYFEKHTIPEIIESTYFIVLCLPMRRLSNVFAPDLKNSDMIVEETAERIISFITGLPK